MSYSDFKDLNPEIIERLSRIEWLSECGKPFLLESKPQFLRARSWGEASLYLISPEWESAVRNASKDLFLWMSEHHRSLYSERRKVIIEAADSCYDRRLRTAINAGRRPFAPVGTAIGAAVEFDIRRTLRGAFFEAAFKDLKHERRFFLNAVSFFEVGHYPCGWTGKWPSGHLVVF